MTVTLNSVQTTTQQVGLETQPGDAPQTHSVSSESTEAAVAVGRDEAAQIAEGARQSQGPSEKNAVADAPSLTLEAPWARSQAAIRENAKELIDRFAAGASAHPFSLSAAAQSEDGDAKDFAVVNNTLRMVHAHLRDAEGAGRFKAEPGTADAALLERARNGTPAEHLAANLALIRVRADGLGAAAQSTAAMHSAALIQASASHFDDEAALLIGNDLFADTLTLFAAKTREQTESAKAGIERTLAAIEAKLTPGAVDERSLFDVIRSELGTLTQAKDAALDVIKDVGYYKDGSADIRAVNFGYRAADGDPCVVLRPESDPVETLDRFGGLMTDKRNVVANELFMLDRRLESAQSALQVAADGASVSQACEKYAAARSVNRQAADVLLPGLEEKSLAVVQSMLDQTFAVESASEASADRSADAAARASSLAQTTAEKFDWHAVTTDRGSRIMALEGEIAQAVKSDRDPKGAFDEALLASHAPLNALRDRALAETLLKAPWTKPATRQAAQAKLDLARNQTGVAAARGAAEALAMLHDDLCVEKTRIASASDIAHNELAKFGIDQAHVKGGIQGGLKALAATMKYGHFAPVTSESGTVTPGRYSRQVLASMVDTVAEGIEARYPEMATALKAQGQAFLEASDEAASRTAFSIISRFLGVIGEFATEAPAAGNAAGAAPAGQVTDPLDELALALTETANGDPAAARAALADLIGSGDIGAAADRAEKLLRSGPGKPETVGLAESFAAAMRGSRAADGASLAGTGKLNALLLSAKYLDGLNYNDFYRELVGGEANSLLNELDAAAYPGVARLINAGAAFRTAPTSVNLLKLTAAILETDPQGLRTALDAAALRKAGGQQAAAGARQQFDAQVEILTRQFNVLVKHRDALFYGAHALYALEQNLADPTDMRQTSAENSLFMHHVRQTLTEKEQKNCLSLMRSGIRGSMGRASTALALASLRTTGAHVSSEAFFDAVGRSADVKIERVLRHYRTHSGGSLQGTQGSIHGFADELAAFRRAAAQDAHIQQIEKAHANTDEARRFQAQALSARLKDLGIDEAQAKKIKKGFVISADSENAKFEAIEGQSAGLALMALNRVAINHYKDIDSETFSMLAGEAVDNAKAGFELTDEALERAVLRAVELPFHEREAAVLLSELMRRMHQAQNRPITLNDVVARLGPKAPAPEDLLNLSAEEVTARYDAYEVDRSQFELTADRLRLAWEHNSASSQASPRGYPEIGVFTLEESYAILEGLGKKILENKLEIDINPARKGLIEDAYQSLLAAFATIKVDQNGLAVKPEQASTNVSAADRRAKALRELAAALTPARFNRGRYVLMTKLHNAKKPSSADEFNRAWKQLGFGDKAEWTQKLRSTLLRETVAQLGDNARVALLANGSLEGQSIADYLHDVDDKRTELALLTATHCAVELSAASIGKSVESLVAADPHWQRRIKVSDIQVRDDQAHLKALLAAKAPGDTVSFAEIVGANLREFLPENAAGGYMNALLANNGKLAASRTRSLFLRSDFLRKQHYFEGVVADIRSAKQGYERFGDLRTARAQQFHLRQRMRFTSCLDAMMPGSSVAITKDGSFHVLGTKFSQSVGAEAPGGKVGVLAQASFSVGLDVDLSDAVVFTKNTDGTVTMRSTKAVQASAQAKASATASFAANGSAGNVDGEFTLAAGGSVGAGAALSFEFGVEKTMDPEAGGVFMDQLFSRAIQAENLNDAKVENTLRGSLSVNVDVSLSAALGFVTQSQEQKKTISSETTTDASGVETKTEVSRLEDGSTETKTTVTDPSGHSQSSTVVRDADGNVRSEKATTTRADGSSVTAKSTSSGLETSYDDVSYDPAGLLNVDARIGASADGAVSCAVVKRETELTKETELSYSGEAAVAYTARVQNEGANVVGDLTEKKLNLSAGQRITFSVESAYTRVNSKTSGNTIDAGKRTTCAFSGRCAASALQAVMRSQGLTTAQSVSIAELMSIAGIEASSISFESSYKGALGNRKLSARELCSPNDYEPEAVTFTFESSNSTTSLLERALNQVGGALNGAFEFSSTATKTQEIRVELDALSRLTPDVIRSILEEESSMGLRAGEIAV